MSKQVPTICECGNNPSNHIIACTCGKFIDIICVPIPTKKAKVKRDYSLAILEMEKATEKRTMWLSGFYLTIEPDKKLAKQLKSAIKLLKGEQC